MRGHLVRFAVWLFDWARAFVQPWLGAPEVLAPTLLVVVIAARNGEALGLPSLLFPETRLPAFVSGMSVTFLFIEVAFVSFLLERSWFGAWVERRSVSFFQKNDFAPYAMLAVGAPAALLMWFAATKLPRADPLWFLGVFVMLLLFAVARGTLARFILEQLRRATDGVRATVNTSTSVTLKSIGAIAQLVRPATMTTNDEVMHALQGVVAVLVFCVHVGVSLFIWIAEIDFPPMFVVCSLAALVTSALGALRNYASRRYNGWVVVVVAVASFVPTPWWVNEYSQLAKDVPRPPYGEGQATDALINDDDAFTAWRAAAARAPLVDEKLARKHCKDETVEAPHLFLVAVSGGGIRAAGWSASVLQSLERDLGAAPQSFSSHVRIIAGASGGMVGAGAWVGSLDADGTHGSIDGLDARDAVMSDALPAIARALAFAPFIDRGKQLEQVWTTKSFGLAQPFRALREGERLGWRPSLVFTPMNVEDGRRVFVSNLDMSKVTTSSGRLLFPIGDDGERYSLNGVQLFRLFPKNGPDMQIATAARMSASFPYVSAAAELPTVPPVRLVDAGYYDNYGVDVVAHWLLEHERDVKECTAGVAIIEIRDESGYGTRNTAALDPGERGKLLVSEVGSPPLAILAAREASMSFRNDELLELLHRLFNGNEERFFTSIVFELHETAPLSWALTDAERRRLSMTDLTTPTSIDYGWAVYELAQWLTLDKEPYLDATEVPFSDDLEAP